MLEKGPTMGMGEYDVLAAKADTKMPEPLGSVMTAANPYGSLGMSDAFDVIRSVSTVE